MASDPNIPLMTMDEAIQSVQAIAPEELLPPAQAQGLMLLAMAAAQPNKVPEEQRKMVVEWAFYVRGAAMLLDLVLAKKMTVFPQPDGSLKFGGKLIKADGVPAAGPTTPKLEVVERRLKEDGGVQPERN